MKTQAGAITLAGVRIEIAKYTFEISETRGMCGAGTGTAQKKTGCIVSEKISTMLGCDVDKEIVVEGEDTVDGGTSVPVCACVSDGVGPCLSKGVWLGLTLWCKMWLLQVWWGGLVVDVTCPMLVGLVEVMNWCKEGNPKADAYSTALNSLQCVLLLLCGVGEGKAAIFENGSDVHVGRVY